MSINNNNRSTSFNPLSNNIGLTKQDIINAANYNVISMYDEQQNEEIKDDSAGGVVATYFDNSSPNPKLKIENLTLNIPQSQINNLSQQLDDLVTNVNDLLQRFSSDTIPRLLYANLTPNVMLYNDDTTTSTPNYNYAREMNLRNPTQNTGATRLTLMSYDASFQYTLEYDETADSVSVYRWDLVNQIEVVVQIINLDELIQLTNLNMSNHQISNVSQLTLSPIDNVTNASFIIKDTLAVLQLLLEYDQPNDVINLWRKTTKILNFQTNQIQSLIPLDMNNNKITNLADGASNNDAVNYGQVSGLISGFNNFLKIDGTNSMTADLNVNSHKLLNVNNGTNPNDAVNFSQLNLKADTTYVDSQDNLKVNLTGGTLTGQLILNADPSNVLGAATKQYVDSVSTNLSTNYLNKTTTSNQTVAGNVDFGSNTVGSTHIPINGSDFTNKTYVDTNFLNKTTSTQQNVVALTQFNGGVDMNGKSIINILDPVNGQDAMTKSYTTTNFLNKTTNTAQTVTSNTTFSQGLNLNNQNITNVLDPTQPQHASTKNYADTNLALKVNKAGDTMTGTLNMGSNNVSSSFVSTSNTDLTNKLFTDTTYLNKITTVAQTVASDVDHGVKKITTSYIPVNDVDLINKLYGDTTYPLKPVTQQIGGVSVAISASDYYKLFLIISNAGIFLPACSTTNKQFRFYNTVSGGSNFIPQGSDLINGVNSPVSCQNQYDYIEATSDGSNNWYVRIIPYKFLNSANSNYLSITGIPSAQVYDVSNFIKSDTSSGIISGLTPSQSSTTQVQVTSGLAVIVDSFTTPSTPSAILITVSSTLTTSITTGVVNNYLFLQPNGTLLIQTTSTTADTYNKIYLARIVLNTAKSGIANIIPRGQVQINAGMQLHTFLRAIGYINLSVIISPNGANMNINSSGGTVVSDGINYTTSFQDPNTKTFLSGSAISFKLCTQSGYTSDTATTTFPNAANYDNGGTLTANSSGNGSSINCRVYLLADGSYVVQYGQTVYANLATASAAVMSEIFIVSPVVSSSVLLCYVSVVKNASTLNATNQAIFTNASSIGNLSASSSSSSGASVIGSGKIDVTNGVVSILAQPSYNIIGNPTAVSATPTDVTPDQLVTCINQATTTPLQLDGIQFNPQIKTAAYTLTTNDNHILANTNSGSYAITLPASSTKNYFKVSKLGTANTLSFTPNAGDSFITSSGTTSTLSLSNQGDSYEFTSNGTTGWITSLLPTLISSGSFKGITFINTSQTYTIPAGVTTMLMFLYSSTAGSTGSGINGTALFSGNGSAGAGCCISYYSSLTPGNTLIISLGTGGIGSGSGPSNTNTIGTGSTITSGTQTITTMTAPAAATKPAFGASGGTSSTPTGGNVLNIPGSPGSIGLYLNIPTLTGSIVPGGAGGQPFMFPGNFDYANTNAVVGSLGCGSTGAPYLSTALTGQSGSNGIALFWLFG